MRSMCIYALLECKWLGSFIAEKSLETDAMESIRCRCEPPKGLGGENPGDTAGQGRPCGSSPKSMSKSIAISSSSSPISCKGM